MSSRNQLKPSGMVNGTRHFATHSRATILLNIARNAASTGVTENNHYLILKLCLAATTLLTCLATIILGYLPFSILRHGQVLGFFSTYAGENTTNSGVVS